MGFRIHRGAWQFKDSSNRFVTKYKLDTAGKLKETDADGNILDDAFMGKTASVNIPSEYLTQSEGDGRYLRSGASQTITGNFAVRDATRVNHQFENYSTVATYRSDAPYWRLWQPDSDEQIAAVNGGEVRLSYDGSHKLKTTSVGVSFVNHIFLPNAANGYRVNKSNSFLNPRDDWNNFHLKDNHGEMYFDSNRYHFRTRSSSEFGLWNSSELRIKSGNISLDNGNVYANRFYDKNNTGYYLDPNSTSRLIKLDVNEYVQAATGIPRNNLGSPTVTEMALFESQFTCKTDLSNDYDDMSDLTFWVQQNEGDAWTEMTVSDGHKRRFLRTNNSNVEIPNRAYKFRVEFNGRHYTFANAIYFYWSSNSHNSQVHIWKKRCSDGQWLQHTSATNTVSSWPGHLYLPFSSIAWHETNTTSTGHYTHIRVEFTPNWSGHATYGDRNINLYGGQVWGGYPSGRRTPHRITEDGNYIFPSSLYADGSGDWGDRLLKRNDILGTDITSHNWNDFISGDSQFSVRSAAGASGSNKPSAYNYGLVMSAHESGGGKLQIYGPHNGSENGNGLWFRTGWGGDFDPWAEIWHSNNDGSGSGLDADLLHGLSGREFARGYNGHRSMNLNDIKHPGLYTYDAGISGDQPEGTNWYNLRTIEIGYNQRFTQMAFPYNSDRVWFRRQVQSNGVWQPWFEFITTANRNSHLTWNNLQGKPSTFTPPSTYLTTTDNDGRYVRKSANAMQQITKDAHTSGASTAHLELYSPQGSTQGEQSIRFHQGGRHWGQIRYNGADFKFTQGSDLNFRPVRAGDIYSNQNLVATQTWVGSQGYLTSLPSHNHDDRYFTESESNTRFAYKAGSNSQDFYVDDLYYDSWIRNHTNNNGLYWSNTGWHFYVGSNNTMNLRSGNNGSCKLLFWTGSTSRNAVYNSSSNEIGFLNTSGSWNFRVEDDGDAHVLKDAYVHRNLSLAGVMYNGNSNTSIDLKDHSNYTWFRNEARVWIFQGGGSGDDWSQTFGLYLPGGSQNTPVYAELGQRNNNGSNGGIYKGVRIVKRVGTSTVDGEIKAGDYYSGSTRVISEGRWVGDSTGLVGPQGPQGPQGDRGATGPQGPAGRDGSDASISFTNQESGQSSSVTSITFNRGEAQFTMADGSVMTIGNARMG